MLATKAPLCNGFGGSKLLDTISLDMDAAAMLAGRLAGDRQQLTKNGLSTGTQAALLESLVSQRNLFRQPTVQSNLSCRWSGPRRGLHQDGVLGTIALLAVRAAAQSPFSSFQQSATLRPASAALSSHFLSSSGGMAKPSAHGDVTSA